MLKDYDSITGKNHYKWKGDKANYSPKHMWIRRHYGRAYKCEFKDNTCGQFFEWSNKDHKYSRNIEDWQQLCRSHHSRYDKKIFGYVHWNLGYRKKKNISCLFCSKVFYPPKKDSKFCSQSCNMRYRNRKLKERNK